MAAYSGVGFKNAIQPESLLPKASLAGKPRVLVDLKRVIHLLGAILFSSFGGRLSRILYARDGREDL
jgi:hypothetical protein